MKPMNIKTILAALLLSGTIAGAVVGLLAGMVIRRADIQ